MRIGTNYGCDYAYGIGIMIASAIFYLLPRDNIIPLMFFVGLFHVILSMVKAAKGYK